MTTAFITIAKKEIIRILRIWQQTLIPPIITTSLYFIIFGTFIGQRIGTVGGFQYIDFIAPGLIMMTIVTNAYSNVASSLFSVKFQSSIEEVLFSPVRKGELFFGYVSGGMMRGVSAGILVVITSLFFTKISVHSASLLAISVALSSFLFSALGFINGLFARKFDDVAIMPAFIITPLLYVGGVFFSVVDLPHAWQILVQLNPMLYIINLFRYCLLGYSDVDPYVSLAFLLLASLAVTPIALKLMVTNKYLRL